MAGPLGPLSTSEQLPLFAGEKLVPLPLRISPPALNAGEARFIWDLRAFWQQVHDKAGWQDTRLIVLRNPAAGGLLLYRGSGFAPDFMHWLKRGERQALGLIDPKGLARKWPQEKLLLITELQSRALSLPVRGFLVSATLPQDMALPPGLTPDPAALAAQRVLLQREPTYVETIMNTLVSALADARTPPIGHGSTALATDPQETP